MSPSNTLILAMSDLFVCFNMQKKNNLVFQYVLHEDFGKSFWATFKETGLFTQC